MPDGGVCRYGLLVPPPLRELSWSPHLCLCLVALDPDLSSLRALPRHPTDLTESLSQTGSSTPQTPSSSSLTRMVDRRLFLSLPLGPFSAARAAYPLTSYPWPHLRSLHWVLVVHLDLGVPASIMVPLGLRDACLILRQPDVSSPGKLLPIHPACSIQHPFLLSIQQPTLVVQPVP